MAMCRKTVGDFLGVMEFMMDVVVYDLYGNIYATIKVQASIFDDAKYTDLLNKEVEDISIYRDKVYLWVEE